MLPTVDSVLPRPVTYFITLLLVAGVVAMLWAAFRRPVREDGGAAFADGASVVLDPGHGGVDGGTVQFGLKEKDLLLDLALQVERALVAKGVRVAMTRREDRSLELADRVAVARANPGALFVSLHLNHFANARVRGIEGYVTTPPQALTLRLEPGDSGRPYRDGRATELARRILAAVEEASSIPARDVRECQFVVTRDAPAPAVLIECGYLSNAADAREFALGQNRQTVAQAIASACDSYLRDARDNRLLGCTAWSGAAVNAKSGEP